MRNLSPTFREEHRLRISENRVFIDTALQIATISIVLRNLWETQLIIATAGCLDGWMDGWMLYMMMY
jgi:hypothetical protein